MKYLSIIRHAQANHAGLAQHDFARTLTEHGLAEAERTASHLLDLAPVVDYVICSAAQRTRQTAIVLQKRLIATWPTPIYLEEAYLANAEILQHLIQNALPDAKHVVLIGHNPGVEELVAKLCKTGTSRINQFMVTGTLAHLQFDIPEWTLLDWGSGNLIQFVRP